MVVLFRAVMEITVDILKMNKEWLATIPVAVWQCEYGGSGIS